MSDTPDIEPVYISPSSLSLEAIRQLDGEELDMLDDIGVHMLQLREAPTNRALVAFGWLQLRRKYPDRNLSYEDSRKHVIWRLDDEEDAAEVLEVDPTESAG